MKKIKVSVIIYFAIAFLLIILLLNSRGVTTGGLGAGIIGLIVWWAITLVYKIFNLDMSVYYNHQGKKITKGEYEKLANKVDFTAPFWKKNK